MILHFTKLKDDMLKQGETIKAKDMMKMETLEKETTGVINETLLLSKEFESHSDQPQKLFVSSIQQKPKLNDIQETLNNTKGKNKIYVYAFSCDANLERTVKECKQLGTIQTIKQSKKTGLQEEIKPNETTPLPQPPMPKNPQAKVAAFAASECNAHPRVVELPKTGEMLGFNVMGGKNSPIYVSRILQGGAADRHQGLKRGDQLISVNVVSVEGEHLDKAVELLKKAKGKVRLVVRYTPRALEELEARFGKT